MPTNTVILGFQESVRDLGAILSEKKERMNTYLVVVV